MAVINLSEGFESVFSSTENIPFKEFKFSGGEIFFKLEKTNLPQEMLDELFIDVRINSSDDFFKLYNCVEALKDNLLWNRFKFKELFIPYFPYGRQDRVMTDGEFNGARSFAKLINQMGFDIVYVFDPHSDVTGSVLNNAKVISNHNFIDWTLLKLQEISQRVVLVSPDAGAEKKIYKLFSSLQSSHIELTDIIHLSKVRDLNNGNLLGIGGELDKFKMYDKNTAFLIVDDIVDGGATFNNIAKEAKLVNPDARMFLAVSHGIFSKGYSKLLDNFEHIFTTDSIGKPIKQLGISRYEIKL